MRHPFPTKFIALLVACCFAAPPLAPVAQQDPAKLTRPRRTGTTTTTNPTTPRTNEPDDITSVTETLEAPSVEVESLRTIEEPSIRVGLATDARSVAISTTGTLLHAATPDSAATPLEVSRVRVEPRAYPALPRSAPNDNAPDIARSGKTKTENNIRLVAGVSAPTRGAVLFGADASPLLDVRAPVIFSSGDEAQHPVKFNEKAYRGRLEVFANTRGTLTVVNVVGLEDYVRGVVPNELSPGSFPAIEALKAQAVAARTYAVSNRSRFAAEGFDLLPTTRSQVYGGRQTEHPLTNRAVDETRGRVATYKGAVINALYTSTCGGRTEDAENIFGGDTVPYLRAHECSLEDHGDALDDYAVRSSRELFNLREAEHADSARHAALLLSFGFGLPTTRVTDEWLSAPATVEDVRALTNVAATLARRPAPAFSQDATRPPAFASALAQAVDGESRGDVLLNKVDVEYLLAFRDADDIPARHRADVAMFLRDGHLMLHADATLRPKQPLSRARALRTVVHLLEARGLLRLEKTTARPSTGGALVVRQPNGKGADKTLAINQEAFLFRAFGENFYQMRELKLVGGEPVAFRADARGEVVYLEARPAPNGAASDRSSAYSRWSVSLTPAEVAGRLNRWANGVGAITGLRVVARGHSRRALDLEVTGTKRTANVRGGRIRSALGLREQLFVIERRHDDAGRIINFTFTGRGWGHGVGMCQVGAYGLARAGLSHEKILKTYYKGIELMKLY